MWCVCALGGVPLVNVCIRCNHCTGLTSGGYIFEEKDGCPLTSPEPVTMLLQLYVVNMLVAALYAATEKRPPTVSGRCRCSQPNRAPPAMHPPCAHKPYLIRKPCTCTPQALSDLQAYDHADERQHAVRPLAGAEAGAPPRARLHTHNTSLGTSFGSHPVHTAPRTHTPSRHLLSPLTHRPPGPHL